MTLPSPRFLTALLAFVVVSDLAAQQSDDPEFNGRRGAEWVQILKSDASARKRKAAVVVLGQMWVDGKYLHAIPNISKALQNDPSPDVRLQAATILGQLTKDDLARREDLRPVVGVLLAAVQSEKVPAVRREAAVSLGRFGELSKAAISGLAGALKDPDPATQAAAAEALGRVGPDAKGAASELLPLLKSPEKAAQLAAIFALSRIAPEDTATVGIAFANLLKTEKDATARKELITALGLLGDHSEAVTQALAAALSEPDPELRRLAARSLSGFGLAIQPAVPALLTAFQTDADKNVRIDALRTLGTGLGATMAQHTSVLVARLNVDADADPKGDPDFEVRIAITDELGALGPVGKDAVPALRRSLRDPQVKVRESAAAAIKKIERPVAKKP